MTHENQNQGRRQPDQEPVDIPPEVSDEEQVVFFANNLILAARRLGGRAIQGTAAAQAPESPTAHQRPSVANVAPQPSPSRSRAQEAAEANSRVLQGATHRLQSRGIAATRPLAALPPGSKKNEEKQWLPGRENQDVSNEAGRIRAEALDLARELKKSGAEPIKMQGDFIWRPRGSYVDRRNIGEIVHGRQPQPRVRYDPSHEGRPKATRGGPEFFYRHEELEIYPVDLPNLLDPKSPPLPNRSQVVNGVGIGIGRDEEGNEFAKIVVIQPSEKHRDQPWALEIPDERLAHGPNGGNGPFDGNYASMPMAGNFRDMVKTDRPPYMTEAVVGLWQDFFALAQKYNQTVPA